MGSSGNYVTHLLVSQPLDDCAMRIYEKHRKSHGGTVQNESHERLEFSFLMQLHDSSSELIESGLKATRVDCMKPDKAICWKPWQTHELLLLSITLYLQYTESRGCASLF